MERYPLYHWINTIIVWLPNMLLEWDLCGQNHINNKDAHFKIHLWNTESFPRVGEAVPEAGLLHSLSSQVMDLYLEFWRSLLYKQFGSSFSHHFNHVQNIIWCVSPSFCSNSDILTARAIYCTRKRMDATKWEELSLSVMNSFFKSGNRNSWVLSEFLMAAWSFLSF